jgi:MalT-like TPR region
MLWMGRTHLSRLLADHRGDDVAAEHLLTEAEAFWRRTGNRSFLADVLIQLGDLNRRRGNLVLAEARFQEVLALSQDLLGPAEIIIETARSQTGLAQVASDRGGAAGAVSRVRAGLERLASIPPEEWSRTGAIGMRLK